MVKKAPVLNRRVQGKVRYKWRTCPYSDCDQSGRIPDGERVPHPVTSGFMALDIRKGYDGLGWRCDDPNCSYFLGTATTPISIPQRKTVINYTTGEYTVTTEFFETPMCSGVKFWES